MANKNDTSTPQNQDTTNSNANTPSGIGYSYEDIVISETDDDYGPTSRTFDMDEEDDDYTVITNTETFGIDKDMDETDSPANSEYHRDNEGHKFSDEK